MGTQLPSPKRAHVYCGQTARWIKMPLDMEVGLGPGHIVLDREPAPPPKKGHSPQFSAHVCCGQIPGWMKMTLGMEVGLSPAHIVLDGNPVPPTKGHSAPPPNFWPMSVVAILLAPMCPHPMRAHWRHLANTIEILHIGTMCRIQLNLCFLQPLKSTTQTANR